MSWGAVAGAAIGVVGGAMGGGKGSSQTTTQEVDPRLAHFLYGEDGKGGLLGDVDKWYQSNKSGMNDQMAQGLNTQWGVLNNPATMAGYQQMSNLGSGLMGAPVVGNPFADGRAALGGGQSPNLGIGQGGQQQAQPQFQSHQMPTGSAVTPTMAGPFSSAMQSYQTPAAPPPPPAAGMSVEDLFNGRKTPTAKSDSGWDWNGVMWQPYRYETGGA